MSGTHVALRADAFARYLDLPRTLTEAAWQDIVSHASNQVDGLSLDDVDADEVATRVPGGWKLSVEAGALVLRACLHECGAGMFEATSDEHPWQDVLDGDTWSFVDPLGEEGFAAWCALAATVGLSPGPSRGPSSLPWWLEAALGGANVGLSSPEALRELVAQLAQHDLVARAAAVIRQSEAPIEDSIRELEGLAELLRRAAEAGHWVLGFELI